jgi:outer membrane cobalamin receptor
MRYYFILFGILFCGLNNVFALEQEPTDTLKPVDLDEIVVTATKASINRNMVPLTISVVSKEKIENSSESALLPVLSEQIPGLFVTERGITGFGVSTGAAGQITLRGIGASPNTQVLVLLNGSPQFMGIMGHPLPDAYVASDVEKVEVIRGPASSLYGSNAMGGVINIITKEQKEEGFRGNLRVMFGSYGTHKYLLNGGYKKQGFTFFASYNRDKTKGERDSADFLIDNGYIRAGYEFSKNLKISADFSLAHYEASDPGMEDQLAGNRIDITRGMGALEIANSFKRTEGSLRVFYNFGEHNITDGFHSTDNNYGMIFYQTYKPFSGNTITAGIDFKNYGGMCENIMAMHGEGIVFGDTAIWEIAGYVSMQQQFFDKLILNIGLRQEHNHVIGSETIPSGGLSFRLSQNTTIKASIAKGYRNPTIRELYLWGTANPHLKPERMINYETGLIQHLMNNTLSLELTLFNATGSNMIYLVAGSEGSHYENTGKFSNTGIEFAGAWRIHKTFHINANYSYISTDKEALATPQQQMNASATYKWKNLTFHLSTQHIHKLYTQISPVLVSDSYTLLNSRIAYSFRNYAQVFIKGENLTQTKYSINFGYPMPGFIFFGGISFHI